MNPTYKEYVFDFSELKLISIFCEKCKTEIVIDVTEIVGGPAPEYCVCGQKFGGNFITSINDFRKAYAYFKENNSNAKARIRIRREVNGAEL